MRTEEIRELEQKIISRGKATHPRSRESDDRYSKNMLDRPPAAHGELLRLDGSDANERVRQHVVFGDRT